jgi:hypothetical protein
MWYHKVGGDVVARAHWHVPGDKYFPFANDILLE